MKARRNIKERTWTTIAQALAAGSGTEALSQAMPYLQAGEFALGAKVVVFTVAMGVLAMAKNWLENQMPDRRRSIETED